MASSARTRRSVGYFRPIALALSRPGLAFPALRLAVEALRSFFYPQFENAVLRRRPVVNVDHSLDPTIPFDPRYIKKYLEFVKLWMGSFHAIWSNYGAEALPRMVEFLASIRRLYADAGRVYLRVHTTTTRPSKNYNLRFALIHAVDPHLNCVPSLHVMLVVANWLLVARLARRLGPAPSRGLGPAELERWAASQYAEAVAITESVLFVKQHSVNCVGASLYYLKSAYPEFDGAAAERFVGDLLADGGLANAPELRAVMLDVCASMERAFEARPELGWRQPLLDFIEGFAPGGHRI